MATAEPRLVTTAARPTRVPPLLVAVASAIAGATMFVLPLFGELAPESAGGDFIHHVALAAAARETLVSTRALPISTDAIHPGVEYPYFLFGNSGFWITSAVVSVLLRASAYVGAGVVVALAFSFGTLGMYALAARSGLNRYLAVAVALLYAAGPYPSINLFLRAAYPEYITWQALPILWLVLEWGLRRDAGLTSVVGGALALAAPFYLHKLLAPHLALTLVALAVVAAPIRVSTLGRLGLIGGVALLLSVPSWLPWLRAFDPGLRATFNPRDLPRVYNASLLNLFWPYAQDSLPNLPANAWYQGRFALQVGIVPSVGFLAGLWVLARRPEQAVRRGIPLLLLLFALIALLIVDAFGIWGLVPSVFHYIQFTYRLLGLAHFVGFVVLLRAVNTGRGPEPGWMRRSCWR